jgi:hypothetical protein
VIRSIIDPAMPVSISVSSTTIAVRIAPSAA